jgi:hypothetical protein
MTDAEQKEPGRRNWITKKNFYIATALSALVWLGYTLDGRASLLEALIMILVSGVFWGAVFTAFIRLSTTQKNKDNDKWGRK